MLGKRYKNSIDTRYLEWCDKAEKVFDDPLKQYRFLKKNDLSTRHLLLFLSESAYKKMNEAPSGNQVDAAHTAKLLMGLSETIRHMRHDLPEEVYASIFTLLEESLLAFITQEPAENS